MFVQRRGALVQIIPVPPRIKPQQRAKQQPDRRLVGGHQHILTRMRPHDVQQRGQGARRHRQPAFASLRCARVGILLPCRRLLGKFFLHLMPRQLLPTPVGNLPSDHRASAPPAHVAAPECSRSPRCVPAAKHTPPRFSPLRAVPPAAPPARGLRRKGAHRWLRRNGLPRTKSWRRDG